MDMSTERRGASAPLGSVEPRAGLLNVPPDGELLYKMMTMENLLRSILGAYLHFNRVDSYADFHGADPHDGQQLSADRVGNVGARFLKSPDFSAADYYDQSRARTYACCFSLENSVHIWRNYATGSAKGQVCVVFEFGRLRATLNRTFRPGNAALEYHVVRCHQIFSLNYGTVEYVDWNRHRANAEHLPNPIRYTYLKSKAFSAEKELRVSLSAIGIGHCALSDGSIMECPPSLHVPFDFRAAMADGMLAQILLASDTNADFLRAELYKLRIVPKYHQMLAGRLRQPTLIQ